MKLDSQFMLRGLLLMLLVGLTPWLAGCTTQGQAEAAMQSDTAMPSAVRMAGGAEFAAASPAPPAADREIIRNGSQTVEVEDLAASIAKIQVSVGKLQGRVENVYQADRSANLSVRVPAAALDGLMDEVAALGDEEVRSTTSQDVTEQVRDLDAELTNQLALRDRFRELAKRAEKVEDILKVERELARVQSRVDSLTGRLKRLRDQVAMSQLQISLTGPDMKTRSVPGPVQWVVRGVGWFVKKLWVIEY